jgi:hypothetical protein
MAPRLLNTVAVFRDVLDAELARSKLQSQGIDAQLADCATIGVSWNYSNALGGVKVQVRSSQIAQASKALRADESAALAAIDAALGRRTALVCPTCRSDAVGEVNNTRKFAAWFMLFGVPLVWFSKRNRCNRCGHRW